MPKNHKQSTISGRNPDPQSFLVPSNNDMDEIHFSLKFCGRGFDSHQIELPEDVWKFRVRLPLHQGPTLATTQNLLLGDLHWDYWVELFPWSTFDLAVFQKPYNREIDDEPQRNVPRKSQQLLLGRYHRLKAHGHIIILIISVQSKKLVTWVEHFFLN